LGGAGLHETEQLLTDRSANTRCAALAALGAMGMTAGNPRTVCAIADALDRPLGPGNGQQGRSSERLEAVRALGQMGPHAVQHAPKVVLLLQDRDARTRATAAVVLVQLIVNFKACAGRSPRTMDLKSVVSDSTIEQMGAVLDSLGNDQLEKIKSALSQ